MDKTIILNMKIKNKRKKEKEKIDIYQKINSILVVVFFWGVGGFSRPLGCWGGVVVGGGGGGKNPT